MTTLMLTVISSIALAITALVVITEFKRDLMMLQQNSYRPERYRKWLAASGDTTSFMRLLAIFLMLFCLATFRVATFDGICVCFWAIWGSGKLLRAKYKKPLVVTKRIRRLENAIALISMAVLGITGVCVSLYATKAATVVFAVMVAMLGIYCASHIIVMAAVKVTAPLEKRINGRFYDMAASKLKSMPELKIIGITGSYGKTSTKHYLERILSEQYETLITPGSFNTTLGVVRTINEMLKPFHQVFIVEMGAKQKGDIAEICRLVNPHYGIITAVGPQHLETFGSIEAVADTKFELADSLKADGTIVLDNEYPMIAKRKVTNCHAIRFVVDDTENDMTSTAENDISYKAVITGVSPQGTQFNLYCPDGKTLSFETALLGHYNICDLTAAIATARVVGVPDEKLHYAVMQIRPVEHRLCPIHHPGGLTVLDDAYNSNPAGAKMAIEVLSSMKTGKRYIITPGMIELGEQQYTLNRKLGEQIAGSGIDYAVIVGQYNRDAILEGLTEKGMDQARIKTFDTFLQANAWLVSVCSPGDVALFENDLPDTFK